LKKGYSPKRTASSPPGIQGLDRYAYVNNSPMNYVDPSGYEPHGPGSCYDAGDLECDKTRQDLLFSRIFKGSNSDGSWTQDDWEYYYKNRTKLYLNPEKWKNSTDTETGWELFAVHVQRLSQYYSLDQKDQFSKDFALLFGGLPTASHNDVQALIASSGGPPFPYSTKADIVWANLFFLITTKKVSRRISEIV